MKYTSKRYNRALFPFYLFATIIELIIMAAQFLIHQLSKKQEFEKQNP